MDAGHPHVVEAFHAASLALGRDRGLLGDGDVGCAPRDDAHQAVELQLHRVEHGQTRLWYQADAVEAGLQSGQHLGAGPRGKDVGVTVGHHPLGDADHLRHGLP